MAGAQADLLGLEIDPAPAVGNQTTLSAPTSATTSRPLNHNGLTVDLPSNNPFRNRATSPNSFSPPPRSPFDDPPPRPVSRNPFLDAPSQPARVASPQDPRMAAVSPQKSISPTAEELFDKLTLDDPSAKKPAPPRPNGTRSPMNRPPGAPPRGDNTVPRTRGPPPSSSHRPTRSQEEALKARRMQAGPSGTKNIFDSPQKRPVRRPRRNSESSIMDKEKPMTEEEKKARELRRKERERRHREGKDKTKPSKRIDLIDQLDHTGIYGLSQFHHDGPFDACNPHRNRKGSRRAPMSAFAEGSVNNTLGGSGPLNRRPDHAAIMGHHDDEAFKDYSTGNNASAYVRPEVPSKTAAVFWDPKTRGEMQHGDESMGLGTSTFLEGAPAARSAIQRREAESAEQIAEQGLQRKKSLAQRFKSINRGPGGPGRGRGGHAPRAYAPRTQEMPSAGSAGERTNSYFDEFDKGGEESITVRGADANGRSPSSPEEMPTIERRSTTDGNAPASPPEGSRQPGGGGFMTRMKSLKGGKRQRPDRGDAGQPQQQPALASPPGV